MLQIPGLYILENNKGRGVYTSKDISPGDLIEICYVVKIPEAELSLVNSTVLYEYYFEWSEKGYGACIALGFGSIYNHSSNPNAETFTDFDDNTIKFYCTKKIPSSSEILIDYTGGKRSKGQLWFDVI